jgi:hypothetical protein
MVSHLVKKAASFKELQGSYRLPRTHESANGPCSVQDVTSPHSHTPAALRPISILSLSH